MKHNLLLQDASGNLHGTTYYGATNNTSVRCVVFEVTPWLFVYKISSCV
jgi:hypothetical protein